jgi:hypothetical protein
MKPLVHVHQFFQVVLCIFLLAAQAMTQTAAKNSLKSSLPAEPQTGAKGILNGSDLTEDFDMGINTSKGLTNWLIKENDCFKMEFPEGQKWAALFITVGEPKDPPRPSLDFSAYKTLSIEMKGASGGEKIEIGIKSNTQSDLGKEKKMPIALTSKWEVYTFPLDNFIGNGLNDLKNIYVVTEFVYNGAKPQIVYFKNIKYLTK